MTLSAAVLAGVITSIIMDLQRHAYKKTKEAVKTALEKRQEKARYDFD